ncbi:MAG: arsenosugar biosynthesis radical SAM protein ArsS [Bdellovibrionales bacterium]|nr:arsenosugar biosynthesis radical SAM protein ArsS [Bdellovibrionales bacterium]
MPSSLPLFADHLVASGVSCSRTAIDTIQINNGRLCNLACLHCHVEAGPKRTELMDERTTRRVIELLEASTGITTLDITGGAPEMNPYFRMTIEEATRLGLQAIDRCNLTIFFEEGYESLPEFLAKHEVHIIASLPCYTSENVDKQRGRGTFDGSIRGLRLLNELGYGRPNSKLRLDLVYNPLGPSLPPSQSSLATDYKKRLFEDFEIEFHELFTITNMPIKRFLHQLEKWGKREEYMELLFRNFNPRAAEAVMCKNLVSIGYDGQLFDCDFNQMLDLPLGGTQRTIWDIESFNELQSSTIAFDSHCFGCTAGAGSSCGGALVSE